MVRCETSVAKMTWIMEPDSTTHGSCGSLWARDWPLQPLFSSSMKWEKHFALRAKLKIRGSKNNTRHKPRAKEALIIIVSEYPLFLNSSENPVKENFSSAALLFRPRPQRFSGALPSGPFAHSPASPGLSAPCSRTFSLLSQCNSASFRGPACRLHHKVPSMHLPCRTKHTRLITSP